MQTKAESMIETTLNISSGFVISLIFTVVAVIRSYIWRRFFSNGIHKKIHKLFAKGV